MSYNSLFKLWYKIFDKTKYQDIKNKRRSEEKIKFYNSHIYDKIVEIQISGEEHSFTKEQFEQIFTLSQTGISQIIKKQKEILKI